MVVTFGTRSYKVCALARSDTGRGSRYDTIAVVMSRQTFLRGAVGAPATSAVFPTILARATPGDGWASLASSIGGQVLLPANGRAFTSGKQIFNSNYSGLNPAAVVTVASQADVRKAVS